MNRPPSVNNNRAIAWALLSQTIWLPLVAIDAHDHWHARVKALTPPVDPDTAATPSPPLPPTRLAVTLPLPSLEEDALGSAQESDQLPRDRSARTGFLLGATPKVPQLSLPSPWLGSIRRAVTTPFRAVIALASPSRWLPAPAVVEAPRKPRVSSEGPARWQGPPIPTSASDLLMRSFTRSELLGGTLGLSDIDDAPMSAVALAERARWSGSVDPMAPLPALWRDPIRRALGQLPGGGVRVERAKVVHVPSMKVTRTTEVPLALQSDGSVDILSQPDDPAVVREIAAWSTRQQAPSRGGVLPAVVLLHPVSEVPPVSASAAIPIPIHSESPVVIQPTSTAKTIRAAAPQAPAASWDEVVPSSPASTTAPQPQAVEPAPQPVVAEVPAPAPAPEAAPIVADPSPTAAVPEADPVPAP